MRRRVQCDCVHSLNDECLARALALSTIPPVRDKAELVSAVISRLPPAEDLRELVDVITTRWEERIEVLAAHVHHLGDDDLHRFVRDVHARCNSADTPEDDGFAYIDAFELGRMSLEERGHRV